MNLDLKSVFRFLSLLLISLFAIYYLPAGVASAWLVGVLVLYWFSNDEPFWLALFLVLSDGFFSFFGFYQVTLSVLPGMPPIEIGEFYVILSVLKARYKQPAYPIFYKNFLVAMGCYIIVLIILGITIGINGEMNAYFRILKVTMPFLLYYSIPKLIRNRDDYMRFLAFVFPVIIFASAAQLFEIIMQEPFSSYLGAKEFLGEELREGEAMRSFYNPGILLLTMFGSLYFSSKTNNKFNSIYVSVLAIISFSMAFLSATRGWILGFGLTLILYAVFVARLKLGRMLAFASIGILFFIVLMRIPDINLQLVNAYDRFSTVEKISEGDVTAGGTQSRTTEYSPRVLQKWAQSPLVGFGFSDDNREYDNPHVGNENILLHSGIIGFSLMMCFFLYFLFKLFSTSLRNSDKSLRAFIVFFLGWFLIHSTSGQHFSYALMPTYTMVQAVYFSFGAFCIAEADNKIT